MKKHILIANGAADTEGDPTAMHKGSQQIEVSGDFYGATVTIEQQFFDGGSYSIEHKHPDNTVIPVEVTTATNQVFVDTGEGFGYSLKAVITGGDTGGTTSIDVTAVEAL